MKFQNVRIMSGLAFITTLFFVNELSHAMPPVKPRHYTERDAVCRFTEDRAGFDTNAAENSAVNLEDEMDSSDNQHRDKKKCWAKIEDCREGQKGCSEDMVVKCNGQVVYGGKFSHKHAHEFEVYSSLDRSKMPTIGIAMDDGMKQSSWLKLSRKGNSLKGSCLVKDRFTNN